MKKKKTNNGDAVDTKLVRSTRAMIIFADTVKEYEQLQVSHKKKKPSEVVECKKKCGGGGGGGGDTPCGNKRVASDKSRKWIRKRKTQKKPSQFQEAKKLANGDHDRDRNWNSGGLWDKQWLKFSNPPYNYPRKCAKQK